MTITNNNPPGGVMITPPVPPTPQNKNGFGHKVTSFGNAIKERRIFGGDKWGELPQREKDYLMVAALVMAVVSLIFSLLFLLGGFGNMAALIPKMAAMASLVNIPLAGFAKSQVMRRNVTTAKDLQIQEQRRKHLENRRLNGYKRLQKLIRLQNNAAAAAA